MVLAVTARVVGKLQRSEGPESSSSDTCLGSALSGVSGLGGLSCPLIPPASYTASPGPSAPPATSDSSGQRAGPLGQRVDCHGAIFGCLHIADISDLVPTIAAYAEDYLACQCENRRVSAVAGGGCSVLPAPMAVVAGEPTGSRAPHPEHPRVGHARRLAIGTSWEPSLGCDHRRPQSNPFDWWKLGGGRAAVHQAGSPHLTRLVKQPNGRRRPL